VREGRLNLDGHQTKQASNSLDQANDALGRMIRETFKWLLAPLQEAKPGKGIGELQWDHFQINPAVINRVEEIERVLKENELLITEWAPIHLAKMLQAWFWKDDTATAGALDVWQKTCCYLYLPRLRDSDTIRSTIAAGLSSRDFFGIAYGVDEGRYQGFHFAENTIPILDESLLLIDPKAAASFAVRLLDEAAEREAKAKGKAAVAANGAREAISSSGGDSSGATSKVDEFSGTSSTASTAGSGPGGASAPAKKRMFFGSVELNPNQAKLQFSDVAEEVLMLLNRPGVKLRIAVEIEAESPNGFEEGVQRAVRENCDQLRFKNRAFED